jgi:DNA-binding MarR family transcriptional regulator
LNHSKISLYLQPLHLQLLYLQLLYLQLIILTYQMEKKVSIELNSVDLIKYALFKEYYLPKEFGINLTQERILMTVKNSINLSMVSISRSIGLEKGPLSKSVDKLEELELIKRIRSSSDKRLVHLSLTSKGETLANEVEKTMESHFSARINVLTEEELNDFFNALSVLKKTANILI